MKRLFAPVLLAALLGAAIASVAAVVVSGRSSSSTKAGRDERPGVISTGTRREVASTALTATQIYKQASAGVVAIKAVTSQGADSGTGIVLNDKGLILTNDHVVAGASSLTVAAKGSSSHTRIGDARRRGSQRRPCADQSRPVGPRPETAHASQARRSVQVGDCGLRDRQPVRPRRDAHAWDRLGARPLDLGPQRLEDHRRDPNRRGAQPGQLRRPAAQRRRPGDRRQLADRQRGGERQRLAAGQHRRWLRGLLRHGRPSGQERSRPERACRRLRRRAGAQCSPKRRRAPEGEGTKRSRRIGARRAYESKPAADGEVESRSAC